MLQVRLDDEDGVGVGAATVEPVGDVDDEATDEDDVMGDGNDTHDVEDDILLLAAAETDLLLGESEAVVMLSDGCSVCTLLLPVRLLLTVTDCAS